MHGNPRPGTRRLILTMAAAVTGVKGLEAIIPVAPNTSYYHYYRSNGLVRHPGGWLGEDIDFLYDFINSGNPDKRDYCARTYRDGEFARGRGHRPDRRRRRGDRRARWREQWPSWRLTGAWRRATKLLRR